MSLVMEYATAYRHVPAGSAVSDEAQRVKAAASELGQSVERSVALLGRKAVAISQIWALANECAETDWDGDGGEPISDLTVRQSLDLIRALPRDLPLPEFAPEPDGSISMDWIASRYRLFSLSIGEGSRLAYAWLDGTDRGHGVAQFDGVTVPTRILEGIRSIVGHGDAAVRPR
jgi:hypothetical protein